MFPTYTWLISVNTVMILISEDSLCSQQKEDITGIPDRQSDSGRESNSLLPFRGGL